MFGFLKEKLKQTVEKFTKEVDKATKEVTPTEEPEEKGFFTRLKEKLIHKEELVEEKHEGKKDKLFTATTEELREFEDAFKEAETVQETKESEEEIIPVITENDQGETIVELHKKPCFHEEKKKKETQKKKPLATKKEEKIVEEGPEESGFFSAIKDTIFKTSLSEEKFEELFWNLELILLENNVAVEVIDMIKANLKRELVERKVLRGQTSDIIIKTLRKSIEQTFDVQPLDIFEKIRTKKPFVIVFVGVNGSGKTTTIAKIVQLLKENNLSCVVAAGDTFRAAAIQQLEEHTKRLNVKLIKHDYGSDPAAVGFDAIKYAHAHAIDCVLIDTAGRLHSNINLMDEMKKIIRVTKPDLKLFVGEAITGNDCVDQARRFHDAVGIDGIILAKADVDEKGGAALSVSYVTGKPILFLGTGQNYGDLEEFDREKIIEQLGLA